MPFADTTRLLAVTARTLPRAGSANLDLMGPPDDLDRARDRLVAAGLERHADAIVALVEPSLRLVPDARDDPQLPVGASKLGGRPDLPRELEWPSFGGVPQSFLAQIDLAAVHRLPGADRLPAAGLLSFFYDSEQRTWGFDPADRGSSQVLYTPQASPLERRDFPAALVDWRFAACGLEAHTELCFPPWESFDVEELGLSRDQRFAYAKTLPGEEQLMHRMLGHPDPVQGDMQLECQLAASGVYCGNATWHRDPRGAELRPGAASWRLLLQIDSDDRAGMTWGDCGRLYYWMRREDLAARRFDRAWCILQCT
jgi:uncharacterized protein YwqG